MPEVALRKQIKEIDLNYKKRSAEPITLREENTELKQEFKIVEDTNHDDTSHDVTAPDETFKGIEVMEAILNDFADEHVKDHPQFGILFQEETDVVDNLTEIDLLTSTISYKLYNQGVYRYRQIALWSHHQFDQILDELDIDPNQLKGENGAW